MNGKELLAVAVALVLIVFFEPVTTVVGLAILAGVFGTGEIAGLGGA